MPRANSTYNNIMISWQQSRKCLYELMNTLISLTVNCKRGAETTLTVRNASTCQKWFESSHASDASAVGRVFKMLEKPSSIDCNFLYRPCSTKD